MRGSRVSLCWASRLFASPSAASDSCPKGGKCSRHCRLRKISSRPQPRDTARQNGPCRASTNSFRASPSGAVTASVIRAADWNARATIPVLRFHLPFGGAAPDIVSERNAVGIVHRTDARQVLFAQLDIEVFLEPIALQPHVVTQEAKQRS